MSKVWLMVMWASAFAAMALGYHHRIVAALGCVAICTASGART